MVWKINKHKKSERQGRISNPTPILESQPKLKSCLKTTNDLEKHRDSLTDSSKLFDDAQHIKAREQSAKSGGSRGARSSNSNLSVESKGSGNSTLSFTIRRRVASVEQRSISSRSWDRESRKSENAQSIQTVSERSSADSRSNIEETKKKVQFTSIYVRDYERVVGDNPSCTIGPPVGIGWEYTEAQEIDVDSFESSRTYRKSTSRLILSREEREALLLNWGASFHDIIESVRSNLKIKNQRRQTVTNLGKIERIEEAFESATRKLKSALMLRRSTGNKVKRLQEQANLAQSALTSLKIAEDRALSEIRGTSHVEIVEEPKGQEDFNSFPLSNYGPPPLEDTEVRRAHMIIPEEDDQPSRRYSLNGNSTTQSEIEIERFHRELELEMFGEEELPSMVGQTLEVPLNGYKDYSREGNKFMAEDSSVNSGMTERYSTDGLDDELLEKEQNRSMISQYLLEDTDKDFTNQASHDQGEQDGKRYYYSSQPAQPLHRDQMTQQTQSGWNSMNAPDFPNGNGSANALYHELYSRKKKTIPLHAGMTMFENCALLGDQTSSSFRRERTRHSSRSSRRGDMNAGPKVQFIPPHTHLAPSHWMDGSDADLLSSGGFNTITISEDNLVDMRPVEGQNGNPYGNVHPSNFY
eukprot:CAMPEP_0116143184 /NCGR_PEP_ID=MMETSP0329-20121206/15311_1 /TAXON_ID=697910 /ORGANISM="Pseudo-nitzschia arenysensis, Strain B593" /LENGTH=639 /DNA_ID=CAMNT_0003638479 /DNA_START=234 /DNA_END=2153 /DNA_ORIENTATION=+